MPRHPKVAEQILPQQTLVIDNGSYAIKAGFVSGDPKLDQCRWVPNCIARDRVFRRPVEKGYLVNWEAEKAIWDNTFIDQGARLKCDPHDTNLVLTEAPNTPAALQNNCDQMIFEEYDFASYSRHIGPSLNAYHDLQSLFGAPPRNSGSQIPPVECLLVIDSGYSHTTVTPLFHGRVIQQAVRRLEIGGKFMTNLLKELVSIRHYNMSDETYLINEVKEAISYVSKNFRQDLEKTRKGFKRRNPDDEELRIDYVLPDYNAHTQGFVRAHDPSLSAKMRKMGSLATAGGVVEDFMTLGNERFTVPEVLFNPRDVGIQQGGLPEMVLQSLSGVPTGLWPAMLANIFVVGGNSKITGFVERLETEIRQLAPSECVVRLVRASDPIKSTWQGGAFLASDTTRLKNVQITRQEYQEHGANWAARVFAGNLTR
ncbi:hypothetical protein G7Y79_00040g076760 [Physcia stellaris]|nr:hypothetical protein G7Y79_00040g076760 [Physcia stellaris]